MDKQEQIGELAEKLSEIVSEIVKEVEELERQSVTTNWDNVKKSLNSSIHYLKQADKQLTDQEPMDGQMSIFDLGVEL